MTIGREETHVVRSEARQVLEGAWRKDRGYCSPNAKAYPHLWLWDSCFHSIAWASLGDRRALTELHAVFAKQFANGFVPHMSYVGRTIHRGPRADVSCFTQPPVYALALTQALQAGMGVDRHLVDATRRGLSYLLDRRRREGLAVVVHPWETGCDDSPRWDSWVGASAWNRVRWTAFDLRLVDATEFAAEEGDAVDNSRFLCAPSLFNGILSHALLLASELSGDAELHTASHELGEAMDGLLWSDEHGMYVDRPVRGGGSSCRLPTLDGVLSALGSVKREHAIACLEQLRDRARFAGPFGLRYLPFAHPDYRPNLYWRGPAWPQLTFLAVIACARWGLDDLAGEIARQGKLAIRNARWSEYWNPESGGGLGARPQTWSALAAAM